MVQTRRKKASITKKENSTDSEPPVKSKTPKGRRGRPPKRESSCTDSSSSTPKVVSQTTSEEREEIKKDENDTLEPSEITFDATVALSPNEKEESFLAPDVVDPSTSVVADEVVVNPPPDVGEELTDAESDPMDIASSESDDGNSNDVNLQCFSSATTEEQKSYENQCSGLEEPKPVTTSDEANKPVVEQEKPKYKLPHIFHPAASAFDEYDRVIIPQPPIPPPPQPPTSSNISTTSFGIKPIKLKAPGRPGISSNPLLLSPSKRPTHFGSTSLNCPPPPTVVDLPIPSFFNNQISVNKISPEKPKEEKKPLTEEEIRLSKEKAAFAAAKINKHFEDMKIKNNDRPDHILAPKRDDRERKHRKMFEEDERRIRDRERERDRERSPFRKHRYDDCRKEEHRRELTVRKEVSTKEESVEKKVVEEEPKKNVVSPAEMVVPPYEIISDCKYMTKNATKKKTESLICDCHEKNLNCSDDGCVNRAMLTECPASCPANCKNQRFAKRKYASVEAYHTGTLKGCGLRALKDIKKGQFIIEYVGEVVERDDYEKRKLKYAADKLHKHHYLCDTGVYTIDATTMGNPSRFINHSCEPNAVCEKWSVPRTPGDVSRIGFFSKRAISAGEEITFDYQFVNYGRDAQKCYCNSESCTGWIGEKVEDDSDDDDEEESEDEDLITTREIELDEEENRLKSLGYMNEVERKQEIENLLSELILRNKKHSKRILRITSMMTDPEQKGSMIDEMFSQDMPFQTQFHYAKEGMTSLFYEWLSINDFSLANLKLMQKIIQTLHGEVFVSCARSDRELIDFVARMSERKLPPELEIQSTVESILTCIDENTLYNYGNVNEQIYNEVVANFDRLCAMAKRLNGHWFNRSVNFRIPKKVKTEQKDEERSTRAGSPNPSSNGENYKSMRFFNSRTEYGSHHRGYYGNFYRENYHNKRKYLHAYHDPSYFNPRKRFRRSRSRTRSPSPIRRKSRYYDDERSSRKSPEKRTPEEREKATPSAESNYSSERAIKSESLPKTNASSSVPGPSVNGNIPSIPVPHPPMPYNHPQNMYDDNYGYNEQMPYPPGFYHGNHFVPAPPAPYPYPPFYQHMPHPANPMFNRFGPKPEWLNIQYQTSELRELLERLEDLTKDMSNCHYAIARHQLRLEMTAERENAINGAPAPEIIIKPPEEDVTRAKTPEEPMPEEPMSIKAPAPKANRYTWAVARTESGDKYFYNKLTKETQWTPPAMELVDPRGMTPPDTTGESEDNEEKERKPTSLSAHLSELIEMVPEEAPETSTKQREQEEAAENARRKVVAVERPRSRQSQQNHFSKADEMAKKFKARLDAIISPIVRGSVKNVRGATQDKINWLVKLVVKEMFKREKTRPDFNYSLSETSVKMVRKYTETLMDRKLRDGGDIWKGYKSIDSRP